MATTAYQDALTAQTDAAAKRINARTGAREENIAQLKTGGIAAANPQDRLDKRADRLGRFYADAPIGLSRRPRRFSREEPAEGADRAPDAGIVLERIINSSELLDIRYLEGGVAAARAVGRVDVRDESARVVAYGTGSLVSPRLVLTNHHVLPDAGAAALSAIEFNYQDGPDGQPLQPQMFQLDPATFFLADQDLDFALVAVRAAPGALDQFGLNPLIEAEGKGVIGENVTIVQHPRGQKKQIALRENQFVDLADPFVHYGRTPSRARRARRCSTTSGRSWRSITRRARAGAGGRVRQRGHPGQADVEFVGAQTSAPDARALADGPGTPARAPAPVAPASSRLARALAPVAGRRSRGRCHLTVSTPT